MVEVDKQVVITGIIALASIYIAFVFAGRSNEIIEPMIIGAIAFAIGVVFPSPKIDNKRGVFIW
jgi:hypothetical protein